MSSTTMSKPFFLSSIGKKYLMGLTGLVWSGFVLAHMLGNLLIFVGPDAYNSYGHALVSGSIIYVAETVLILSFLAHVGCALSLTLENRSARGARGYAVQPMGAKGASLASRTMAIQGSLLLVFLITHIASFKYGPVYETTVKGVVMRDLHKMIVEAFQNPGFVGWYIVALLGLGFHLSHGFGSIFQSLGLKNARNEKQIKILSSLYGALIALGFLAQPIYCFMRGV